MLTLNDIINVSFRKSGFSGYKTEDVDAFIDQVKESYEALIKKTIDQKEELEKKEEEKRQLVGKVDALAARLEDYRKEEEEIKNALVSAQKLGDASVREARHKAEIIIKDATLKADRIVAGAKAELEDRKEDLEGLKQSASEFRSKLLDMYKQHLTLINAIPTYHTEKPEEPVAVQEPEVPEVSTEPIQEEVAPSAPDYAEDLHVSVSNFEDDPLADDFDASGLSDLTKEADDDETDSFFNSSL